MNLFFAFINPFSLILIINIIVLLTYNKISVNFYLIILPISFLTVGYFFYLSRLIRNLQLKGSNKLLTLTGGVWRMFGTMIIVVGGIEVVYFGVPLLGQVRYVDFGFSVFHHIAVSSWLLVFVQFKRRWLNRFKLTYCLIFPLIIFNRDVFLLTICCLILVALLNKKINFRYLILTVTIFVVIFAQLGSIRSGNVQDIIDLPVLFDLSDYGLVVFWIFSYVTSPMFNVHFNYDTGGRVLYEPLLTVFPEFYKWVEVHPYFGMYGYFVFGATMMLLPSLLRFPGWLCFSFFFYYQFTMGCVFGNKLMNTHTVYVILLFLSITAVNQFLTKKSRLRN